MDKDVKDFLEWLSDTSEHADNSIWSIDGALKTKNEYQIFLKIFSKEQASFLKDLIRQTIWLVDKWHNELNEESHFDIREQIKKLQAQFRNHRHDYTKKFSDKAVY